jgi:2,5-diketo-D-gluconate reductase A
MNIPKITLNNGVEIPQLGFGTYQIDPGETVAATKAAIEVGVRHIDTAQMYGNEAQVGQAIRESGIERDEFFVTSKLNNSFHAFDDAMSAFDRTLAELNIGHLDLFLIHWPLPEVGDFTETWRAMEKMYESGKVRAIGVSNFQASHLQRLQETAQVTPAVNQIEVHPYMTQDELRTVNSAMGIATEAWSPIAQGKVLSDTVVDEVARRHAKSPAQAVLRWHIQRGDIVFPKSVTRSRVEENCDIFDFELSADEMTAISQLNKNERVGPDPDTFNYVPS